MSSQSDTLTSKRKVESFVGAVKSDVVKGAGKGNKKGDKAKNGGSPGEASGKSKSEITTQDAKDSKGSFQWKNGKGKGWREKSQGSQRWEPRRAFRAWGKSWINWKKQISGVYGPTTGQVTQVAEEETAKEGVATPKKAEGGGPE